MGSAGTDTHYTGNIDHEFQFLKDGNFLIDEFEKLTGLKIWAISDWANNNTCEILKDSPLSKKDSRFRKGNILFSYSFLDSIGIIAYPEGEIVWDFISTFGRTTGAEGIYRAYRYSPEYIKPLLDRIKKQMPGRKNDDEKKH